MHIVFEKIFILKFILSLFHVTVMTVADLENSFCNMQSDTFDYVALKTYQDLKLHQVTIFYNKTVDTLSLELNIAIQKIIQINPAVVINMATFNLVTPNKFLSSSVIENPRRLSLYAVLINENSNMEKKMVQVEQFINMLIQLSPMAIRPRFLLLFLRNDFLNEYILEELLQYAWSKKFIDFSIISWKCHFNKTLDLHLYYLNPFFNTFVKKDYYHNEEIFPDKLINVSQYPFKLLVTNQKPFISFSTDKYGNKKVEGAHYNILKIAIEKMNFNLIHYYIDVNSTLHAAVLHESFKALKNGHINMLPQGIPDLFPGFNEMNLGCNYYDTLTAMVPVISHTKLELPTYVLISVGLNPLLMIGIMHVARWLKLHTINIGTFKILQVIFGIPIDLEPKKLSDRIIYLSILLISLAYTTIYYSQFLDVQIVETEETFDTFKDIADSKYNIYINKRYYDTLLPNDTEDTLKIKNRAKPVSDIQECLKLLNTKRVICITNYFYATYLATKYLDAAGKPLCKIAKPVFSEGKLKFSVEHAFPYAEKFQATFQRIYESGIWPRAARRIRRVIANNSIETEVKSDDVFVYELIGMIGIGYTLSVVALVSEFFVRWLKPPEQHVHRISVQSNNV